MKVPAQHILSTRCIGIDRASQRAAMFGADSLAEGQAGWAGGAPVINYVKADGQNLVVASGHKIWHPRDIETQRATMSRRACRYVRANDIKRP